MLRTGLLAQALTEAGHDVTWWTSTFDVTSGRQVFDQDTRREVDGVAIEFLHSTGYRSPTSPRRLLEQRGVAKAFAKRAHHCKQPDIVVASYPTPELCAAALRYAKPRCVPAIVDVRDIWPESWGDGTSTWVRPAIRAAGLPFRRMARTISAEASSISGVSDGAVDWLLAASSRPRAFGDRTFPPVYQQPCLGAEELAGAAGFWDEQGISRAGGRTVVCFFGTFSRHFAFEPVLSAADILSHEPDSSIQLVLCGRGPNLLRCRTLAAHNPSVMLPGWVDAAKIDALMGIASAGLVAYVPGLNFRTVVTNKAIEYLSSGLPIIANAGTAVAQITEDFSCGLSYELSRPETLVAALKELNGNSELQRSLSINARETFVANFDPKKVLQCFVEYLELTADLSER